MPPDTSTEPAAAPPYRRLAVVGAGAWGTALAIVASANAQVDLWAREAEIRDSIAARHENSLFLPGIVLPASIVPIAEIGAAGAADAILLASPAQHLRSVLESLRGFVKAGTPIVLAAKGIETGTGLLPTEVLEEIVPQAEPAILSGPSFARDVARGLPTAVTIAARDANAAARLAATMNRSGFRPYVSDDLAGVALGGAAKNVYAIACGMVEGAGFGESARAATLSRGFAELLRLGSGMGARMETLVGLSGLGDLALTATSISSRNFALGVALGIGVMPSGALAEGAATAPALVARARRHGIELPIAEAVADVLAGKLGVKAAAERLLARPLRNE